MQVSINGQLQKADASENGYITLTRKWGNQDKIEISFPLGLHTETMPDNPNRLAVFLWPGSAGRPSLGCYKNRYTRNGIGFFVAKDAGQHYRAIKNSQPVGIIGHCFGMKPKREADFQFYPGSPISG